MKYPDGHEAIGTFIKIPNGVTYINYGNYMQLGFFLQGRLNGWGGVYKWVKELTILDIIKMVY